METSQNEKAAEADGKGYGYAPIVHAVSLCLMLALTWICLSGYFTPLLLSLGVLSVAISVFVSMRMDLHDHEGVPIQFGPRIFLYWLWLFREIIKANIDVARRVVQRHPDITPTLFITPMSQKTEIGQVLYANSITLTPGTVSVVLDDSHIQVHALTQGAADDLLEGGMDRQVTSVER